MKLLPIAWLWPDADELLHLTGRVGTLFYGLEEKGEALGR